MAVCLLYFLIPRRYQWFLLLGASYFFYGCWNVKYLFILIISTCIVYITALLLRRYSAYRKQLLAISIIANLAILLLFKYSGFMYGNLSLLSSYLELPFFKDSFKMLMPIGISFYIFKAVSYLIDVYRNRIEPERHFGYLALYVSFFPQLLAGPIERSTLFIPQVKKEFSYDYQRIVEGLKLMAWGFFKKLVIADRLALYVDRAYSDPASFAGMPLLLAAYFFTIQIYCDFSGYSDIAIGSAKILGYEGMDNFRRPYFSRTMQEFWSRWHISLSTWFRDYLYIPLGGNRVSRLRWSLNIMAVFLLSGLWHGANWSFVAWGGIHGIFLLFGRFTLGLRDKMKHSVLSIFRLEKEHGPAPLMSMIESAWSIAVTFHLAAFAWVFFRAESFSGAASIITHVFTWSRGDVTLGFTPMEFILMISTVPCLVVLDCIQEKRGGRHPFTQQRPPARWALYYFVILCIVFFGVFGQSKFIYFNF